MEAGNADGSLPSDDEQADVTADAAAKATKPKSAEAIAQKKIIDDNYGLYEHLSDEELLKAVPKKEDGTPTSIGAILHDAGTCRACNFFHFSATGCNSGIRCRYCHAEHKKKRTRKRQAKEEKKGAIDDGKQEGCSVEGNGKEAKKQRTSEFNVDDDTDVPLDWKGNSRPCWLKDEDLHEAPPFWHPPPMTSYHPSWPPPLANSVGHAGNQSTAGWATDYYARR